MSWDLILDLIVLGVFLLIIHQDPLHLWSPERARIVGHALALLFLLLALFTIASWVHSPTQDVTDPSGGRSGLTLHTDHETGCQYLSTAFGGLHPRLSASGEHMNCKDPLP